MCHVPSTISDRMMPRSRCPPGCTVLEIVIALVILSIGILALIGTAATATRLVAQAGRYTHTAALATAQLEALRSQDCDAVTGGTRSDGNWTVAWSVTGGDAAARNVTVVVDEPAPDGVRRHVFAGVVPC